MIFEINLFFSVIYCYLLRNKKNFIYFLPIIFIWSVIIGFQYEVGTDYNNYLSIFSNEYRLPYFKKRKEYLFWIMISLFQQLGIKGQIDFFIISLFQNFIFFFALKKYRKLINLRIWLFIYLFLGYTTIFFSQMNGVRQYISIYILFYSFIFLLEEKKVKYTIGNICAMLFHKSSIIFFMFIFIQEYLKKKYSKKFLIIFLIVSGVIGFMDLNIEVFRDVISKIPVYNHYIYTHFIDGKILWSNKITKIIYIPLYIYSIILLNNKINCTIKRRLFNIGILFYGMKNILLISYLLTRVSELLNILLIFPIYFLIEELLVRKKNFVLNGLMILIFIIFSLKVLIFPYGEFLYKSYFFN